VRNHDVMIGILRIRRHVGRRRPACAFRSGVLNADGKRIALSGLTYSGCAKTLVPMVPDDGSWKYKSTTRDRPDHSGTDGNRHRCRRPSLSRACRGAPTGSPSPIRSRIPPARIAIIPAGRRIECGHRPYRIPVAPTSLLSFGRDGPCAHQAQCRRQALVVVASDKVFLSKVIDAPRTARPSIFRCRRTGRRRLCAGDGLPSARPGDGTRTGALHRAGLADARQFAAHADRADRRAEKDPAAPALTVPVQ